MGWEIGDGDEQQDIYSPRGYSMMCMETVSKEGEQKKTEEILKKRFPKMDEVHLDPSSVVAIISRLDPPWVMEMEMFLSHVPGMPQLMSPALSNGSMSRDGILGMSIVPEEASSSSLKGARLFARPPQWDLALKSVEIVAKEKRRPKLLVRFNADCAILNLNLSFFGFLETRQRTHGRKLNQPVLTP